MSQPTLVPSSQTAPPASAATRLTSKATGKPVLKRKLPKEVIWLGVAVAVALLIINFIEPTVVIADGEVITPGLTSVGVNGLAVIIPTMILWLSVGTGWTSLLAIAALIALQVLTPGQAWASSLGSPLIATILIFSLLARQLKVSGVIDWVAAWFITRPFLKGRPRMFLATLVFSQLFLGFAVQGLSLGIIYLDLVTRLAEKLGVKKGSSLYTVLVQGVLWGNGVVNTISPLVATWPLTMIGMLAAAGYTVTPAMWLAASIPFAFLGFLVIVICTVAARPDVTALKQLDFDEFKANQPPLTRAGKLSIAVVTGAFVFIMLPGLFDVMGIFEGFASYVSSMGITVPGIAAIALLGLIRDKGQSILKYEDLMKTNPTSSLVFLASIFAISVPLSSEAAGINVWLNSLLSPIFGGLSPFWIIAAAVIGSTVLTNFMSNSVTMILFFTIGSSLLYGVDSTSIPTLGVLMVLSSSMAVLIQPASVLPALAFSEKHVTVAKTWKTNLLYMFGTMLVMIAMIPWIQNVFA